MRMDFETELSLPDVLCAACIWKEGGDCDGDPSCETYKYMEDKMQTQGADSVILLYNTEMVWSYDSKNDSRTIYKIRYN